jgi:hypothetical protein
MCWCDPQKRTPWCDNCKDWHNGKPDSERRIHSISAQQIHERFNGLIHIEADKPGDHLQGFPRPNDRGKETERTVLHRERHHNFPRTYEINSKIEVTSMWPVLEERGADFSRISQLGSSQV